MWDFMGLGLSTGEELGGVLLNSGSAALGVGPCLPLPLHMPLSHSLTLCLSFPASVTSGSFSWGNSFSRGGCWRERSQGLTW